MKRQTGKKFLFSMFLAVGVAFMLSACGSGGGTSSSSSSGTTSDGVAGSSSTETATVTAVSSLASTSGGGADASGGTASTSLTVADKVSVVEADSSSIASPVMRASSDMFMALGVDAATNHTTLSAISGSDYATDPQSVYISERSTEAFGVINDILCIISNTKADDTTLMNSGTYTAQVNEKTCSSDRDNAGGQSSDGASASQATNYQYWTVNSYRADDSSAQIIAVWGHMEMYGGTDTTTGKESKVKTVVVGRVVVSESASTTNPYGKFIFTFRIWPEGTDGHADLSGGETTAIMKGFLAAVDDGSGQIVLKFGIKSNSSGAAFTESKLATLYRASDGSSGSGTVELIEGFNKDAGAKKFSFDFNSTAFLRGIAGDSTSEKCLDRASFDETVWRYNIYDSAGKRIPVNSGYPIKYTDTSSVNHFGWMGYWGLWLEGITASNISGKTVNKVDWSGGTEALTPRVAFVSNGKLVKHTNASMALSSMHGVPFEWGTWDSTASKWIQYQLEWNATDQLFYKTAQMDSSSWTWDALATPVAITTATAELNNEWELWFWSQSLGGSGRIKLKSDAGTFSYPTNSTLVKYQTESTIYPGDTTVPATLMCFENCPDASAMATTSPYYSNTNWESGGATISSSNNTVSTTTVKAGAGTYYYEYAYNTSTMVLTDSNRGTAVVQNSAPTGDNNGYGVHSGQLIDPADFTDANFGCPWSTTTTTCSWRMYETVTSYYTYQTGPQPWSRFTGLYADNDSSGTLTTGDEFDTFSPPVQVAYTKTNTDSTTTKYFLEYGGYGDLWGIPGKCVDEAGADTDCYDSTGTTFIRWVPEFSIPDGGEVDNSGTTNYVKSLEKEQRMKENTSACSALSLTAYTLPDPVDFFVDPSDSTKVYYVGVEPSLADAPIKVIDGVVQ